MHGSFPLPCSLNLACSLGRYQFQALVPWLAQGMDMAGCREGALPGVQLLWGKGSSAADSASAQQHLVF